jgi:glycine/D-amino acid oxidase-like deaminating enzyme
VFWLADPAAPAALPSLVGAVEADLVVVGGGYTGLWTALQAKEAEPGRDVVLVEAATIGWAASGRNGGFCASSLTHGEANGLDRFPGEFDTLERLGRQNLDGIEATITRHGIDAEFERTGELDIAVEDWQVAELTGVRPAPRGARRRTSLVGPRPDPGAGALADLPRESATTPMAWRWCTRPSWPGGYARRASTSGCGYTNTLRSPRSSPTEPAWRCAARSARSGDGR